MRRRLHRVVIAAQRPAAQLTIKILLALLVTLLYGGHQAANHAGNVPLLKETLGLHKTLPSPGPGAEAAYTALLGSMLLFNTLLPRSRGSEYRLQLALINWLLAALTLFITATVGWNWLQDATGQRGLEYLETTQIYTGVLGLTLLIWILAANGAIRIFLRIRAAIRRRRQGG